MNKKQTAVQWLVQEITKKYDKSFTEFYKAEIEQANAMFEGQIIDARQDGSNRMFRKGERKEITNEQYFTETYGENEKTN